MHATGHVGVALAAAAPLVLALAAVGLGELALPASALLVGLSTLPDVDEYVPGMAHRGVTHSPAFALGVGLLGAGLGWLVAPAVGSGDASALAVVGFVIGSLAVGLHVIADVVTPMGVYPLWPISRERRSLGLVRSADGRVNLALFGLGLGGWSLAMALVGL